ncbi:C4-dicarboxylate ABC transporter permease [Pueribacillus theae]|uniref:C4-dicarboxylate ABC transporter permease n=1 Tax=Pueribacillus theae TaxID=2171751 RepID=A0A2U1JRH5_9BACI|nr:TRAP transporter permease [Pueribacillus theae]PWA07796.1 C4-dicarboxylate ABC transporter permease [Pueribacillus theae]
MGKGVQDSKNIMKRLVLFIAIVLSLFQLYTGGFGLLTAMLQRSLHLTLVLILIFLLYPVHFSKKWRWIDFLAILLAIGSCIYIFLTYEDLLFRVGDPNMFDIFFGIVTILLVLEATRRVTGWILATIGALFIFYSYFGAILPGIFHSTNMSTNRFISLMYMSTDGLWGTTLGVAATFVALFIIFGAFLNATGAGKVFIDLAYIVGGRFRGGPAKVAVISSALMGTVSGSPVANVSTTGQFTIPLMKSVGYRPKVAGAIEAVASTGGSIMPPIMGAGAFVMAEMTGIPYAKIIIAAAIPAILYYLSVYFYVDFEAAKENLKGMAKDELPVFKEVFFKGFHLYIGLGMLIYLLVFAKASPMFSAFWSIVAIVVSYVVLYFKQVDWNFLTKALEDGAKGMLLTTVACATAGVVVGVANLTGIGVRLTTLMVNLGESSILLTLVVTMVACIIMGMGLPPTASYILLGVLTAPALIKLGVEPLFAHMFVFYFACLAPITPPVALASYTGAGIAKSDPMETSFTSAKIGLVAFIIPYMFIFGPELLAQGPPLNIIWAFIMATVGVFVLAVGLTGFYRRNLTWYERILAIGTALLLITPELITDIIGFILLGILAVLIYFTRKKEVENLENGEFENSI